MRRPRWRDPRLGVGIVLVAGSVALGSWVVSTADASVEVYQAHEPLSPGEVVDVDDLAVVQVQLDDVEDVYLVPGALDGQALVVRTVTEGELVPLAALGDAADVDVRPVQVPMPASMSETITAGSRVDLWVAHPDPADSGAFTEPDLVIEAAEVADVRADTSVFAGTDQVQAQVLVPSEQLPTVLAVLAVEGQITLVPVPGGTS